jgi:RNA polymerase sigma factor (TIGR02999 family)
MDNESVQHTVTRLIHQWKNGDADAFSALMPLVYDELRRLARKYMASENSGHTLQHTALVHEAYLQLVGMDIGWKDRAHFFAVAARAMRRILVDHARTRKADKRGGEFAHIALDEDVVKAAPRRTVDILDVDTALQKLAALDSRKSEMIEMRYFGGLSQEELAEVFGISIATVNRDLSSAKEWLSAELGPARSS